MHALILIDIQNDFLPNGPLAVPEGDQVIAVANLEMQRADYVVATQDWHPANHGSFASQQADVEIGDQFQLDGLTQVAWPDHCIQGTRGAELATELNLDRIDHIVQKGTCPTIDSYSGFFDNGQRQVTGLDDHLRSIGVRHLSVMGLATDYCVKFSVLDALQLEYPTRVLLDGCRGINLSPNDIDDAVAAMRLAGAEIIEPYDFSI
ncbi:MAG: bifunctional nicotinamidase/pyrazinamidase [Rubripirellula sp.]|nr:bifunctional nicotinamidase/pyrazinamidase [Rubripirellula sp.]